MLVRVVLGEKQDKRMTFEKISRESMQKNEFLEFPGVTKE